MAAKIYKPLAEQVANPIHRQPSSENALAPRSSSPQHFLCPEVNGFPETKTHLRLVLVSAAILHSIQKAEPESIRVKTQEELEGYKSEIEHLKEIYLRRQDELSQLQQKSESLHSQLSEQTNIVNNLSRLETMANMKNESLQMENQRLNMELSNYQKKNVRIHEQLTQVQHTNKALELQNHDHCLKLHEKESILSVLQTKNDSIIKENTLQSVEMIEQSRTIERLIQERQSATKIINELSAKLEHLETSKSTEIGKLSEQVQSTQQSHRAVLAEIERKDQKTEEMQQSFEEKVQDLNVQVSGLQEENKMLKEKCENVSICRPHDDRVNSSENLDGLRKKRSIAVEKRKSIFDDIQDLRGNVRVFCRIRPPPPRSKVKPFISLPTATTGNNWNVICKDEYFTFDRVFPSESSNADVYRETAGVVELVLHGLNVCILAYGQTGSGKTYTMDGSSSDPGVNLRALKHLFNIIDDMPQTVKVQMSALEIYNDGIYDLLGEATGQRIRSHKQHDLPNSEQLHIRDLPTSPNSVHIPGLTKVTVMSVQEVQTAIQKARKRRSTNSTSMNSSSSRSHCIIQIEVIQDGNISMLHLVDLAGSERIDRSKVHGERLVETRHINKSLAALGNVFFALESNNRHVPYRDTKLTHLLKQSIGGHAKTLMLVTISNDTKDKFETTATLEFGKRVGNIILSDTQSEEKIHRLRHLELQLLDTEREIETITCQIQK